MVLRRVADENVVRGFGSSFRPYIDLRVDNFLLVGPPTYRDYP